MTSEKAWSAVVSSLCLLCSFISVASTQSQDEEEIEVVPDKVYNSHPGLTDEEATQEDIKLFLRQPAYIALIVIFILIFVAMWIVPDLPPHGSKKTKK